MHLPPARSPFIGTAVVALAAGLLAVGAPQAAHASLPNDEALEVRIDSLSPSVVPRTKVLRIEGTVTNLSSDEWTSLEVYPAVSTTPITSAEELDEQALTDPHTSVANLITTPACECSDTIPTLAPEESLTFSLGVPRDQLPIGTAPGVYWLEIQVYGETDAGRDDVADGRARTFLPQAAERDGPPVKAALVLPLRADIRYEGDGSLTDPASWTGDLTSPGRLSSLVRLGAAARPRQRLTWMVDPAVLTAAEALSRGNPARNLGRTVEPPDGEPSPPAESDPAGSAASSGETAQTSRAALAAQRAASQWLEDADVALADRPLLTLPFGDVDVAAAAAVNRRMYRLAEKRAGRELPVLRLPAGPAVAPPTGYLSDAALELVNRRATVFVGEDALPGAETTVIRTKRRRLVVTASGASGGGPGPGDRTALVNMRQRILSEAAVRYQAGDESMCIVLPADWSPRVDSVPTAREFFEALDVPWLRLVTVRALGRGEAADQAELAYPAQQQRRELDRQDFRTARRLIALGRQMDRVLPANDTVARQVTDEALSAVSYAAREDPEDRRLAVDRSRNVISGQLRQVTVQVPRSVTLSSRRGLIFVVVSNGLEQEVEVQVRTASGDGEGLRLADSSLIDLAPGERRPLELRVLDSAIGVHDTSFIVTDEKGRPTGAAPVEVRVTTTQISRVIWVIMAIGATLLFTAIALRLYRRITAYRVRRRAPASTP